MARIWITRIFAVYAVAACIVSAAIAMATRSNAHPDEVVHGDAFCYFQNHLWPPPLNSDGLIYGPDGMSRVYSGEIVYWLWGRIGAVGAAVAPLTDGAGQIVKHFQPEPADGPFYSFLPFIAAPPLCLFDMRAYRLLNTALLAATLSVLLYCGRRHLWPLLLAAIVFCVPQVIYVYSYANSDAWGLSMSLFLFTFAVTNRRPLAARGPTLLLGVLTGLIILSKQPFWATLPFAWLWIAAHSGWARLADWTASQRRTVAQNLLLLIITVLVVVTPLKIIYPLSIPYYRQGVEQMREERAAAGFRPGDFYQPGFRLAATGFPFDAVWRNPEWYRSSASSFYGKFGYMTVALPALHYLAAGGLFSLFLALTYWFGFAHWRLLTHDVKLALCASPIFVAIIVLASLYNSWTYDNQPQGRYLFPTLIPLALMVSVTLPYEPRWSRLLRAGGWLTAAAMCLFTLYHYVLANTALTR